MGVLSGYEYVLGFLIACNLIPVLALTASKILRPSNGGPETLTTYESGMEPIGGAWIQFNIRYYMFALVFVVFDVETVFLYPWAVAFNTPERAAQESATRSVRSLIGVNGVSRRGMFIRVLCSVSPGPCFNGIGPGPSMSCKTAPPWIRSANATNYV